MPDATEQAAEQALLKRLRADGLLLPMSMLDEHCWSILRSVVRELAMRPHMPRRDRGRP